MSSTINTTSSLFDLLFVSRSNSKNTQPSLAVDFHIDSVLAVDLPRDSVLAVTDPIINDASAYDHWTIRWSSALRTDSPKQLKEFSDLMTGAKTPSMKWWALFISVNNDDDPLREDLKREILLAVDTVEGDDRRPSISEVAVRANPELARALANPLIPTEVHLDDPFRTGEALTQIMVNANLVIKNVEHKHRYPSSDIMISVEKCGDLLTNAAAIFDAIKKMERNMSDDDHSVLKHYAGIALYSACAFFMFSLAREVKVLPNTTGTDGHDSRVIKIADEFELYRLRPDGEWSELVIQGWLVRSKRFIRTQEFSLLTSAVRDAVNLSVTELERAQQQPLETRRLSAYQSHLDLISTCESWFQQRLQECWTPHSDSNRVVFDYFQAFHALHEEGVRGRFSEEVEFVSRLETKPGPVRAHIERDMGFSGTDKGGGNATEASDTEQRSMREAVEKYLLKTNTQRRDQPYVIGYFIQLFIDVQAEDRGFMIETINTEDVRPRASHKLHQSTIDDISALKSRGLQRVYGELAWLYPKVAVGASVNAILHFNPSVMQSARRRTMINYRKHSQTLQSFEASQTSHASQASQASVTSEPSEVHDFWSQRAKEYGRRPLLRYPMQNDVTSFGSQADERKVSDAGWAFDIVQQLAELSRNRIHDPSVETYLSGDTSYIDSAPAPKRKNSFACLYTI